MKPLHLPLSLLFFFLMAGSLFAQKKFDLSKRNVFVPGPDGIVRCASVEVDAHRREIYPGLGTPEQFEQWLAPKVREYKEAAAQGRTNNIITIPVVVHVLHNGEPMGTAPNITDAQVISQIDVLNEDFRRIMNTNGYNQDPVGADVELEFCLAITDPYGNSTNGINRVNIGQNGVTADDMDNTFKASTIWDPNQYMNMWSVKFVAPDDGILGYAQFPENSGLEGMPTTPQAANTDGVVIRYQSFGSIEKNDGTFILSPTYDLGRTATHEVGHWVGLRHIWGDGLGCNLGAAPPGCSCLQDDYCEDTPNSDQANYGCPEGKFSPCDLPNITYDMYQNYMDYSDDVCMNIFTIDQKARVQAVMANSPRRMELVNSPACQAPRPFVKFAAAQTSVTEGSSCGTKTVDVEVKMTQASAVPVTVSFTADGSATAGIWNDYTAPSPMEVTFTPGSTSKMLTFTIYEDDRVEANEFIALRIDLVTTTGNVVKGVTNQHHLIGIQDDDVAPEVAGSSPQVLIFTENFNTLGAGWTQTSMSGSSATWKIGTPPLGLGGNFNAYISRGDLPGNLYLYNYNASASARLESPAINAANARNMVLNFTYSCMGEEGFDFGTLWYSKNGGAWTQFGPPELSSQPLPTSISVPLPEDANNTSQLRIGFKWDNDDLLGTDPPFSFDNIELRGTAGSPADVLTALSNGIADAYMAPNTTAHFYDPATGKVMLTLTNNSTYDYGCTTVAVDRSMASAGGAAVAFSSASPSTYLAAKTFRIVPANNNAPSGSGMSVKMYYKNTEITAWELATGQSRNNLKAVKVAGNPVSAVNPGNAGSFTIETQNAVKGTFNGNVTVTAGFQNVSGGFGVGVPGGSQALVVNPVSTFNPVEKADLQTPILTSLFPNPANNLVELTYITFDNEPVEILLKNYMGQTVETSINMDSARASIETGGLPDGVYLVVLKRGSEQEVKRVVVQH